MTKDDKLAIINYMKWPYDKDGEICYYDWEGKRPRDLDLNDAGLCVKEMQKRKDWDDFVIYAKADTEKQCRTWSQLFAWLYVDDYFFTIFAAWLKERKK